MINFLKRGAETTRGHDEAWFKELAGRMVEILRK